MTRAACISRRVPRARLRTALAGAVLLLTACASQPPLPAAGSALARDDLTWLRRDGFGVDSADVARYRALGRDGLLDAQLADRVPGSLPPPSPT